MPRPANRVVVATRGIDQGRNFVGGPHPGDLSNVGLIIPTEATGTVSTRYLFRLVTIRVQARHRFWITGVRQLLTIAARVPIARTPPVVPEPEYILLERQVITPTWSFPDGNVSWHLMRCPIDATVATPPTAYRQGWSRDTYGSEPALVYIRPTDPAVPLQYIPPGNGIPPGDAISTYGHMNDMREPWYQRMQSAALRIEVLGPCSIIFYASVLQTDPATRPVPAVGLGPEQFTGLEGLEPEDQFWIPYSASARYHRIAGEISGEMEPLEDQQKLAECVPPRCG